MRSFQEMDKIIQKADQLLKAWELSFKDKEWSDTLRLKKELQELIYYYYHKPKS